jgi:hypothetical protein
MLVCLFQRNLLTIAPNQHLFFVFFTPTKLPNPEASGAKRASLFRLLA